MCRAALLGISWLGRCRILPWLHSKLAGRCHDSGTERTEDFRGYGQDPEGRYRAGKGCRVKRTALYMRVSTKGHGQTTETQALALRDYAAHRGFTIVEEYRDEGISGLKDSRPALDKLMRDARARRFDVVVVARFDRFARSVSHLLRALEEFGHLGVDFVSVSESINTSTPMGKMIFTVLGAVAELERNLIRERVVMGLER